MPLALADYAARPDADLVRAACAGEIDAFGALFERHRPRLHATALAILGYRPEAEDAVHDTFLRALTRLSTLRDPAAAPGWLQGITRNCARMSLRRRGRYASPAETERCFAELAEEGLVESRIEAREMRDWIWSALAHLPETIRATVMLRHFASFSSYEEVAQIMGVPVGTIRSRLHDARLRLADLLLASAGLRPNDADRETRARRRYYRERYSELYRGGRDAFLSDYAEDVEIVWSPGNWSRPSRTRGREHLEAEIDDDLMTGVHIAPAACLASGAVTVLEGTVANPAEMPFHCPPGVAFVLFSDGRHIGRAHIFFAPRPPQPDA